MGDQRQAQRRRMEPDARRAEILGVARRLFGANGYATVSTSDIAAEAGVARALINHYFGGKRS
ncbi:helix-turn-helix domain-containing protein, partial [Streptomyces sp. NPDC006356]